MHAAHQAQGDNSPRTLQLRMRSRDGAEVDVRLVLYRPFAHRAVTHTVVPAPVIFQCAIADAVATNADIRHSPRANVYEEFEAARGTSWQYELQQVRYANQRLLDEIAVVEAQLGVQPVPPMYGAPSQTTAPIQRQQQVMGSATAVPPTINAQQQQQQQSMMGVRPTSHASGMHVPPIVTALPPQVQDWSALSAASSQLSSRKRTWEGIDSGGG